MQSAQNLKSIIIIPNVCHNTEVPLINFTLSCGSGGFVPQEPQEKQCDPISSSENTASINVKEYLTGFIEWIPNKFTPLAYK